MYFCQGNHNLKRVPGIISFTGNGEKTDCKSLKAFRVALTVAQSVTGVSSSSAALPTCLFSVLITVPGPSLPSLTLSSICALAGAYGCMCVCVSNWTHV